MECANSKLKLKNAIGRAAKNLLVISASLYRKVPLYGKLVGILKGIKNHTSKVFKIAERKKIGRRVMWTSDVTNPCICESFR